MTLLVAAGAGGDLLHREGFVGLQCVGLPMAECVTVLSLRKVPVEIFVLFPSLDFFILVSS